MINVQFSKVDCYVISPLRKPVFATPARTLAGKSSRTPIWRQLAEALRLLILDGRLALDSRLPGERELAAVLQVSRTTVASAMAQLREEGYLESRHGSGSRVILPEHIRHVPTRTSTGTALDLSTAALSAGPEIHQAYQQALFAMPQHLLSSGYLPQGLSVLRESIARHYCERGLPTQPDEIMVVNGAVSGLALILRLLTGPGDRVVVDHPTYPLTIAAIQGRHVAPSACRCPSTVGIRRVWSPPSRKLHREWPI